MLVTRVMFVDLCSWVTKMARAEAPFPNYPGWPTARQTDEKDLHLKARSKTVIVSVLRVSWRPSQTVGNRTLLQIWRPPTTLSIRYTASSSDILAVLAMDSINSTCTYYNTVNKRILITANKRIHIILAWFRVSCPLLTQSPVIVFFIN